MKNLTVRIRNTTPTQREARLVLTARGATGQEETLDLGKLSIDAEAATDIDVPVQALPVQTAGTATTVQVVAHYESPNNSVAGTPLPENSAAMTSHSEWRYVTHDSDFENATVRTNHEEAARNGDLFFQGALPELEELRTADPLSPNVIQANEATKVPTQMIVSLPHGAIPSPIASSGEE